MAKITKETERMTVMDEAKERVVFSMLFVDDAKAEREDMGTGDYLEREFGWLQQSGIRLDEWALAESDSTSEWERYIHYLFRWAFEHYDEEFEGCSPASFEEWRCLEDETQ